MKQATYCQASYLLSGRLSAVMKQATYSQASYLQSGRLSAVMKLAPNFRIHAPKRFRIHAPNFRIYFVLNIKLIHDVNIFLLNIILIHYVNIYVYLTSN